MSVKVHVESIGAIGPGAANWAEWRAILCGETSYQANRTVAPILSVLPSAERRRVGISVKIALASGLEALANASVDPSTMTTVFCSSGGDGENCHLICETLAGSDRLISPTRFHNSVHNAPSGYWGIASGAMLPSTSLCAHDAGFSVGLLDAAVQCSVEKRPVLVVVYDTPYPEPLHGVRPITDQFAISMLLTPEMTQQSMAAIELSLDKIAPTLMDNSALENVRVGIPAARGLPLMQRLACMPQDATPADVYLEYVNHQSLRVKFKPT